MAPAGAVGLAGVEGGPDVVGAGVAVLGLGVGKVGSVGPAPGEATGRPSMLELQPETGMALTSRGESSSDPPARPHRAFCDNRTRNSRKFRYRDQITHEVSKVTAVTRLWTPVDAEPMVQVYRCVTDSRIASAAR
jgi:hypothetical protein